MGALGVFLTADGSSLAVARDGQVVADGHLARDRGRWALTVREAGPGTAVDPEAVSALLVGLVQLARRAGGGCVRWTVSSPTADDDEAADGAGLTGRRDVIQLRRSLPVGPADRAGTAPVVTRAFRPGHDEEAWLAVNNRAFAAHPDQGGQTVADVRDLEAAPGFDPEGFLLLDADDGRAGSDRSRGVLDGFCWTKVHPDLHPPLGEIFVIGVDPDAQHRGLGAALTLAGLDHLHRRGLRVGMLYVDADNTGARATYARLGFDHHHLDRMYQTVV